MASTPKQSCDKRKEIGMLADLRLYQLISPLLPIGGFTYSQGLEWSVEQHWVRDQQTLQHWVEGLLTHSMATLELPILLRILQAYQEGNSANLIHWCSYLLASRETLELRKEERQRGAALAKLLPNLGVVIPDEIKDTVTSTQLAGLGLAAHHWDIPPHQLCAGHAWSWLENTVSAGIKLIPLGQTQGQQILLQLAGKIPDAVAKASQVDDSNIGSSTPALAIASSNHETQYTRLFRS